MTRVRKVKSGILELRKNNHVKLEPNLIIKQWASIQCISYTTTKEISLTFQILPPPFEFYNCLHSLRGMQPMQACD